MNPADLARATADLARIADDLARVARDLANASTTATDPDITTPTVSIPEAARMLGVSRETAYRMARDGQLPCIRLGARTVRVRTEPLLRLISGGAA